MNPSIQIDTWLSLAVWNADENSQLGYGLSDNGQKDAMGKYRQWRSVVRDILIKREGEAKWRWKQSVSNQSHEL